jgi:Ca2+-binding RTX toxin-like protein
VLCSPAILAAALLSAFALAPLSAQAAPSPTGPTCAEGPQRVGDTIVGTPCADRIVVPVSVTYVDGAAGDDVIIGDSSAGSSAGPVAAGACAPHCGVGSQTFEGGPGDDIIYGDRGNDILRGNAGDDRLYGGIGDDRLEGGPGNDWLSGGFGADTIDGGEGNDYVRGDGTQDHIFDTGGGHDTLSFATGVTPGFGAGIETGVSDFPTGSEGERGVYLNLGAGGENANNGIAASGGGVDEVEPGVFERIVGTPFSDYIVGTGEEIIGGGGADVIKGGGGADVLRGGADGDHLEDGPGATMFGEAGSDNCAGGGSVSGCEGSAAEVQTRDTNKVSVGETSAGSGSTDVYLVGSSGSDAVTATYEGTAVAFSLASGSFDQSASGAGGCSVTTATSASCPLEAPAAPNVPALDSILLAGMAGNDTITANGFPDGSSVVAIGGAGADTLTGGGSEDVLVDGPPTETSADRLYGGAGDDALIHNGGADYLDGGEGSDLFLSVSLCDGETIYGGTERPGDRDNASWARLAGSVDARLDEGLAGEVGPEGQPVCASGSLDRLEGIEDLEGSSGSDYLVGDAGANQLLGHKGEDTYYAEGGEDLILANSGSRDAVIDCGPGTDSAVIDLASVGDPTPIECESVREGAPEEFRTEIEEPAVPTPVVAPPVPALPTAAPNPTPPRTRILSRPAKLVRVRKLPTRLVFRFNASEHGATFRCKLDRGRFKPCHSPRAYEVGAGLHVFKVFAIDPAGNTDPTPALFRFRIRHL